MNTIVTDDKHADKKTGGQDSQAQCKPVGDVQAQIHQIPGKQIGWQGIGDLPETPM